MILFSKYLDNNVHAHILSYLSLEDIAQLRLVNKTFKGHLDIPKMDIMWQPFINRLKVMDTPISAPDFNQERPLYQCFKDGFDKINKSQIEELTLFKNWLKWNTLLLPTIFTNELNSFKDEPATTLEELEKRERYLNDISEYLIREKIYDNSNNDKTFYLGSNLISRIPNALFEDEQLKNYWANIEEFNCFWSRLRTLPEGIGQCKQLKVLQCSDNALLTLPASLGLCTELEKLYCSNNQLETLPKSLRHCKKLEIIYCSHNTLKILPDLFDQQTELTELDCSYNKLQDLPGSLKGCLNLLLLHCAGNHLSNIEDFYKIIGRSDLMTPSDCYQELPNDPMELEINDDNDNVDNVEENSLGLGGQKRKRENDNHYECEDRNDGNHDGNDNDDDETDEDKKEVKKRKRGCWPFC